MNKQEWIQQIDKYHALANDIRMQLWENPEVAGEENKLTGAHKCKKHRNFSVQFAQKNKSK